MHPFRPSPYDCDEGDPILLISDMLHPGSWQEGDHRIWAHPSDGRVFRFERRLVCAGGGIKAMAWVRVG